jgi:hypothetical protein
MKFSNEYIDINNDTKFVSCLEEKEISIDIPNVSVYDYNSKKVQFTLMTRHLNVLTQFNTYFTTIYENVIQHFISCQSIWFNKKKIDKVKLYESYKSPVLTNITSKEIQFIVFYDNKLDKFKYILSDGKQNKKLLLNSSISFSGYQFSNTGIVPIFTLNNLTNMNDITKHNVNQSSFSKFVGGNLNYINAPTEMYENSESIPDKQKKINENINPQNEVSVKSSKSVVSNHSVKSSKSVVSNHSVKSSKNAFVDENSLEHSKKVDELTNKIMNKLSNELKKEVSAIISQEISNQKSFNENSHSNNKPTLNDINNSSDNKDINDSSNEESDLFSSDSFDSEIEFDDENTEGGSKLFTQDFSETYDETETSQLNKINKLLNE